jgi:hypothetical protein
MWYGEIEVTRLALLVLPVAPHGHPAGHSRSLDINYGAPKLGQQSHRDSYPSRGVSYARTTVATTNSNTHSRAQSVERVALI